MVDLVVDNFAPIHSYVIDRAALAEGLLSFDEESPYLEDYRLLLRLAQKHRLTFVSMNKDVAEYWIYDCGMNTTTHAAHRFSQAANEWRRAYELTQKMKGQLSLTLSLIDIELWYRTLLCRSGLRTGDDVVSDAVIAVAWSHRDSLTICHDVLNQDR